MAGKAPQVEAPEEVEEIRERRGIKKGLYILPSAFTAANIGMGYYSVMASLRGFQLLDEDLSAATVQFDHAARAIGWAALFDALDGRIARMTKTTTEMGIQLDSLADVLTFGIAPAVLAYAWGYGSSLPDGSQAQKLGWFVSFMFLMCGALRLARFNVQATRPRTLSEGTGKVDKKNFVGLPIPAAAGLIAAFVHFAPSPIKAYDAGLHGLYSGLAMGVIAALGALMVSTIRYSSFKTVGGGRRSRATIFLFIAAVGMLIWLYSRYTLLAIVSAYVLHGLVLRFLSLFRSRQPNEAR